MCDVEPKVQTFPFNQIPKTLQLSGLPGCETLDTPAKNPPAKTLDHGVGLLSLELQSKERERERERERETMGSPKGRGD